MLKNRISKVIVLMVGIMLVFTLIGCGDADGGPTGSIPQVVTFTGTKDGITYSLKITEDTSRAAYTPQGGDTYEFTASSKKSTGTVQTYSGGILTLMPSNSETPFEATVSGTGLTKLNGTIKWTDDTSNYFDNAVLSSGNSGDDKPGPGSNIASIYRITHIGGYYVLNESQTPQIWLDITANAVIWNYQDYEYPFDDIEVRFDDATTNGGGNIMAGGSPIGSWAYLYSGSAKVGILRILGGKIVIHTGSYTGAEVTMLNALGIYPDISDIAGSTKSVVADQP